MAGLGPAIHVLAVAQDVDARDKRGHDGGVMKLNSQDLERIARLTLEHYNRRAEQFWEGTRDHDVSQNIAALLQHIEGAAAVHHPRFRLRAGPRSQGVLRSRPRRDRSGRRRAVRRDGARLQRLRGLAAGLSQARSARGHFDGVFANASLFHVPGQELPRVLRELHATLKPGGVLFSSNPRGHNEEGWNRGRYGAYHDLETWRRYVSGAGFVELAHYYRPPGLPREQQPWLASVWRR